MDVIEKVDSSVIQHGDRNNRIYLMHLDSKDASSLPAKLMDIAVEKRYTKIFAKVPSTALQYFQREQFHKEAYVPNFYHGKTGMYCLAKFLDHSRENIPVAERLEIRKNIQLTKTKNRNVSPPDIGVEISRLGNRDAESLANLFKTVLKTYPFPIFDPEYVAKSMNSGTLYYGMIDGKDLVAAATADMDKENENVEMTDFAVHPEFRGRSAALALLLHMEEQVRQQHIKTSYTIARALSPAMNITFSKAGYIYGGTLVNNTQISGKIESMNVWYKSL